ncbi:hypothetical protein PA905_49290 [Planktothrix agardhii CCAP 1459/11A]|jgi:hypothetical protein|uniref:Uncharacterized protein n=1 Tax=Planktothrix agardhii CCAP 1459/11A TaxID=282420 RepID=A0A4P6A5B7_PLAAG|nr:MULTISPECIES: hypothetical protein [Planktothrix]MCF3607032.1 hypothetical protein [Planktothrix agardhii 1033]GDZ96377.1 hypothetical protein PA905_49290 [Planktothrix agardhii CCAP 1459/11A]
MSAISDSFKEYFKGFDLEIPDPIPVKGKIQKGGWNVTYVLNQGNDELTCLDFFAEHRMSSPSHVRILNDGTIVGLESYQESYSYDQNIEGDEERANKAMQEHNDRVSEILKAKGLF